MNDKHSKELIRKGRDAMRLFRELESQGWISKVRHHELLLELRSIISMPVTTQVKCTMVDNLANGLVPNYIKVFHRLAFHLCGIIVTLAILWGLS